MEREHLATQCHVLTGHHWEICSFFSSIFRVYHLRKLGKISMQELDSRSIYFVHSGILHFHHGKKELNRNPDHGTKELTLGIYKPGDFFQLPTGPNQATMDHQLTAIRPSKLLIADYVDIERLSAENRWIMDMHTIIAQRALQKTLCHLRILQTATALQRFEMIRSHFGSYLLDIPYQYQAAFMGISRKHLSRIFLRSMQRDLGKNILRDKNGDSDGK